MEAGLPELGTEKGEGGHTEAEGPGGESGWRGNEAKGEGEGKGRERTRPDGSGVNEGRRASRTLQRKKNGMKTSEEGRRRGCYLLATVSLPISPVSQPLAPALGASMGVGYGILDSGPGA